MLQADGGTRTAAITGAYVALADAVTWLQSAGSVSGNPLTGHVAAISVGVIDGEVRLDLPYEEDSRAEVDLNIVGFDGGKLVEVQGTAEGEPFDRDAMSAMLDLGQKGIDELIAEQKRALDAPYPGELPSPVKR